MMYSVLVGVHMPGEPPDDERPRNHEPDGAPPIAVVLALNFIRASNESMGARILDRSNRITGEVREVIREVDMHPKQEAAFKQACNLLGVYFDAETERIERERLLSAAAVADELLEAGRVLGFEPDDDDKRDTMSP
jgi:hypothetical protein